MQEKLLQQILTKLDALQQDVTGLKSDTTVIKQDVSGIKSNLDYVWEDVKVIEERLDAHDVKLRIAK